MLFNFCEHLGLRFSKFALFPARKPCLGGLFSIKCLGLAMNDFALTFDQDLRQIGGRAVYVIPNVVLQLQK